MDFSSFNLSTVIMLVLAISIAYVAIKIVSNIIYKIICFFIGGLLLVFVLTQLGISIPMLSYLANYVLDATKIAFENLQNILQQVK